MTTTLTPAVLEENLLTTTERAEIAKKIRTSNVIAFALVSLAVFTLVAVINPLLAVTVALPLIAVVGYAQYRGQDEQIARELDRIELEIATID